MPMYIALPSWHRYFIHLTTAANPQTKPTDLCFKTAGRLLPSTSSIAIYYCYSVRKLITIIEGRRKFVQAHVSSCRSHCFRGKHYALNKNCEVCKINENETIPAIAWSCVED